MLGQKTPQLFLVDADIIGMITKSEKNVSAEQPQKNGLALVTNGRSVIKTLVAFGERNFGPFFGHQPFRKLNGERNGHSHPKHSA